MMLPTLCFLLLLFTFPSTLCKTSKKHSDKHSDSEDKHKAKHKPDLLPNICSSLGIVAKYSYADKSIIAIGKNVFILPQWNHTFLSVPSKSGNKNWSSLIYKLMYGVAPTQQQVLGQHFLDASKRTPGLLLDDELDKAWLLVRSPYVRLLSVCLRKTGPDTNNAYFKKYSRSKGGATFEDVLRGIEKDVLHHDNHRSLSPLERSVRLCKLDHHLCIQSSYVFLSRADNVRVLMLEHQAIWYAQLLECLGIEGDQVVGEDWLNFGPRPCFYTPTDLCDDALKPQNITGLKLDADPMHGHGSAGLVLDYYTKELASIATYLYEYDLDLLGYPRWDGSAPFPEPGPY